MGNQKKLSHTLINLGFVCALGTTEHIGGSARESIVKAGTPSTCDYNNGTNVVYDEEGRPWVMHGSKMTDAILHELRTYPLQRGAYVPHSNDGGYFMRKVLPTLFPSRTNPPIDDKVVVAF